MYIVGIMGYGPVNHLPDLDLYSQDVDVWIGADRGIVTLMKIEIHVNYTLGDFDAIDSNQKKTVQQKADVFEIHPPEKDKTDLEIALQKALSLEPDTIYLFGVTGARLDHALLNLQLLHKMIHNNIRGMIIDKWNEVEMAVPGTYNVK